MPHIAHLSVHRYDGLQLRLVLVVNLKVAQRCNLVDKMFRELRLFLFGNLMARIAPELAGVDKERQELAFRAVLRKLDMVAAFRLRHNPFQHRHTAESAWQNL